MSSLPSQFSALTVAEQTARRLKMLAALEIDVWSTRTGPAPEQGLPHQAPLEQVALKQTPLKQTPLKQSRGGNGPAAARALLEESASTGSQRKRSGGAAEAGQPGTTVDNSPEHDLHAAGSSSAAETPPSTHPSHPSKVSPAASPATPGEATPSAATPSAAKPTAVPTEAPVDLLCLSGKHGLLLIRQTGLSPQARRLLKDILHSVMRLIGDRLANATTADTRSAGPRSQLQSLRFSWPPSGTDGEVMADTDTARALRGFLNRQMQGKVEPVVLYSGGDLAELLARVELPIDPARCIALLPPEQLMSDSAHKRALWRTLNAL